MLSVYSEEDEKHETYLLEIVGKSRYNHSHHDPNHEKQSFSVGNGIVLYLSSIL